jgi:hypothetical protein
MVVSKAFTPEHDMNLPVTVMNTTLDNLIHSHDQSRVVAYMRLVQIHNLAEFGHGASLTHFGNQTRPAKSEATSRPHEGLKLLREHVLQHVFVKTQVSNDKLELTALFLKKLKFTKPRWTQLTYFSH